jgi:hypothetical protein
MSIGPFGPNNDQHSATRDEKEAVNSSGVAPHSGLIRFTKLDFEDTLDDRAASLPKLIRKFLEA